MGVLEEITQMRSQGISDEDIVGNLQEQGISPQAINDAINQAEIKRAVTEPTQYQDENVPSPDQGYGEQPYAGNTQEVDGNMYMPQQQEYQEYYPQTQGGYDQGYAGTDTSTIIEVAEQVFSEKIQKIQRQVKELTEFKTLTESTVEHLIERVKRVENMLDKMQVAILDKVGSYGRNLNTVRKEMDMMQDSFTKMVPSLAEKARHHQTHSIKTPGKSSVKKSVKKVSRRR